MLRDKGNMRRRKFHGLSRRPFLRRAGVGRGRWGGLRGWLICRKHIDMYTVYPGREVHIGKKRILHNSSVQKQTFMHVQWAEKKPARDAPWVDSMNFISQLL